ncbi:sigma-70 family RNA polymerase sigma factor [Nocardioides zeae]|uniref:Sigma-70 family RNA polymerase sigma factor n=1 Tax=Nocardioides imazamoxiresistens TaxID=3231893 RepID=A0ABU3PRD6_9ACTN|nr:sigma-70 family RNA polymerase sigma factor [Nocardioides zeae]MDT9591432.1 sigma-70 family RNA polymerase sigma factor [Nocardioides zeae]
MTVTVLPTGSAASAPVDAAPVVPPSIRQTHAEERAERRARTTQLFLEAAAAPTEAARAERIREVVVANMGVARALASRHRGRGVATDDLEQVAYMALVRAADQFDIDQADDFLTYAVPCIKGELRRHFRDHGWMIRPPRPVQEIQSKVVRTRDELAGDHGDNVPVEAIAEHLGVEPTLVRQALEAEGCFHPVSLDAPLPPDLSMAASDTSVDDVAQQEVIDARESLRPALGALSDRERRLLLLRFFHERTQQDIADELGITQTQVSRLLTKVLRTLRGRIDTPIAS